VQSKCLDIGPVTLSGGSIKVLIDFIVVTLPIPLILRLRLPPRDKLGVVVLLSCGYLITICSIIRAYYVWKVLYSTYDTWNMYPSYLAGSAESHIAVVSQHLIVVTSPANLYPFHRFALVFLRSKLCFLGSMLRSLLTSKQETIVSRAVRVVKQDNQKKLKSVEMRSCLCFLLAFYTPIWRSCKGPAGMLVCGIE
jgi:rhodopsin domain-containing protein